MGTIEIKCRFSGRVLFSHDAEYNSVKLTVEAAVKASADLRSANLFSADLRSADLRSADLRSANLRSAKNAESAIAKTVLTPEGAFIAWKACQPGCIVKLRIPEDARRSNASGRKCRAEFVDVLEVIGADVGVTEAHGPRTEYRVGQRVTADGWDENRWEECSHGIHFFITRQEAEDWNK